jgi:hypothetical protein
MLSGSDKFAELREKGTNGINCGLMTEDIIARLSEWDRAYGLAITGVGHDRVEFVLEKLPENLDSFVREVYRFCPDTVDQGFGCFADAYGGDAPADLPEGVAELIEGIDFDDAEYGLEIMKRSIRRDHKVGLWWD